MPDDPTRPGKPFDQPEQVDPTEGAVPEVSELFAPGEIAPAEGMRAKYGQRLERLPKRYQDILRMLCQKIAERDLFARIDEILRAAEQRFYWRSMFDIYFNEQNYVWEMPGRTATDATQDNGDSRLSYAFNIYQAFGRGFISQVGHPPNVRLKSADPTDPMGLEIATAANKRKEKIESVNDIGQLAKDQARFEWTDGRPAIYTRWVANGARFGFEDAPSVEETPEGLGQGQEPPPKRPRAPKGGVVMDVYGVLEVRVPITMRRQCDFPFIQLSFEIDLTTAKSMYPHISNAISGSTPGPGEYEFDTVTRVAINQGLRLLTQTGDTVHQIPTWQRTWMRPSMFAEIDDKDERLFFEQNFPDGVMVAFVGDTYAESRNESMDDHWVVYYPIEGDGQQTPSCGYVLMAVQDALNDLTDLQMEAALKSIPATYWNKEIIDLQAISKQKAGPGANYPLKNVGDKRVADNVWQEQPVDLKASTVALYQQMLKDIPERLSGQYDAVMGATDPANQTKGGILALADASRGYQGPAWRSWQSAYAKALEQAILIDDYFSDETERTGLKKGTFRAVPESDQNLPQTFEEQQRAYQAISESAAMGFQPALDWLMVPQNRVLGQKFIGIPGSVMPGANAAEKQLREIQEMLEEAPVPNVQAQQMFQQITIAAAAVGATPPPEPPPEKMYDTSIPIDAAIEDNKTEAETCKEWMNGQEGQKAKRENAMGYLNVKLHFLAHQQAAQQQAEQAMGQQIKAAGAMEAAKAKGKAAATPQDDHISANFKDFPTEGKLQIAAKRGIALNPATIEQHDQRERDAKASKSFPIQ